ncbi:MAG: hypothetical protein DRN90_03110 [Thermoproteota archaeon]|nr:MAG: hypothetical protein DRN90_03110 [Candidatus Korarchaeota archaeon]
MPTYRRKTNRTYDIARCRERLKGAKIATNGLYKKLSTGEEILSGKLIVIGDADLKKVEETPIPINLEEGDLGKVGIACSEFENLEITKAKTRMGRGKNCIIIRRPCRIL